jgi:hypothetical protein
LKMPWSKAIEEMSTKMQNTTDRISKVILDHAKKTHDKSMDQLSIFKRSEQIKYNRLNARIVELETCFKSEIAHFKKTLEMQERAAATDAEKASL